MSAEPGLPKDQAAVISLLVAQGRTYGDVARLLAIDERAVVTRARRALQALAPGETTPMPVADRELLSDYLLGQLAGDAADRARRLLGESRSARVWARGAASALDMDPAKRPVIPAAHLAAPPADRTPPAAFRAPRMPERAHPALAAGSGEQGGHRAESAGAPAPGSRVGGAILLAAMALLLVVAIVFVTRSGGGGGQGAVTGGGPASVSSATTRSATPFHVLGSSPLSTGPAGGLAQGVAEIVSEGSQRALVVAGRRLAPTAGLAAGGFDYTLWLSGRAGTRELGVAPPVGRDGVLQALGSLPAAASGPQTVLVTRETTAKPTAPGPVVLSGRMPAG